MRIALLSYRSKPHCGGQGVYVRHLSRELTALGHTVEVFSGQPYPELDEGVLLTKVPSLDLYREPDPFRIPKPREYRDLTDVREVLSMCTAGFPEPRTFATRVARLLRRRIGDFDIVHDNQVLGYGVLDIAKQLGDDKGSAMYFAAEFDAPAARPAEIRIGTPNAWKLWLNGEFLFGREEYHRGEELDQYRVPAQFKAGKNLILLKVLQNEQTDASAQSYKFRLRVCDSTGQAILPATPQTARP